MDPGEPARRANEPLALELGDTIQEALRAVGTNFVTFAVLGALVIVPYTALGVAIATLTTPFTQDLVLGRVDLDRMLAALAVALPAYVAILLVTTATYSVGQGAVMYATVEHLVGRRASLVDALRAGLSRAFSLFACALLVNVVIVAGCALCCAPGVVALVWLIAALPACAVEKLGPIASIQRSIELTEGNRGMIFLIGLIVFLAFFGLSVCILGPTSLIAGQGLGPAELPDPLSPAQLVSATINMVMQIGWFMIGSAIIAVIYARLRGLREDVDAAALSRVFA